MKNSLKSCLYQYVIFPLKNTGATFHDRTTSDVSIVGQRMTYGNGISYLEEEKQNEMSQVASKLQSKEHQKNISNKPAKG